jgi:hypothetical protein
MKNLTWSERFTRLRSHFGWTYKSISIMLDCSEGSIQNLIRNKTQKMGIGFRFAIIVFELSNGLTSQEELLPPMSEDDKPDSHYLDKLL